MDSRQVKLVKSVMLELGYQKVESNVLNEYEKAYNGYRIQITFYKGEKTDTFRGSFASIIKVPAIGDSDNFNEIYERYGHFQTVKDTLKFILD